MNKINIKVELKKLLLSFYFISFVIYGALTPSKILFLDTLSYQIPFQIFVCIVPTIYYFVLRKKFEKCIQFSFETKYLLYSFLFCLSFFFTFLFPMDYNLFNDEQSYVMTSHNHGIEIITKLFPTFQYLDGFYIKHLVRIVSILISIICILHLYLFQKIKTKYTIIYITLALFCLRPVFILIGGNMSPHPVGNLIPFLISGSIFGFAPAVFKITVLFLFSIFFIFITQKYFNFGNYFIKLIFLLVLFSFPPIIHYAQTVEPSFWSFMLFTGVGLYILTNKCKNYENIVILITLFCFMRQPSFIALIPILWSNLNALKLKKFKSANLLVMIRNYFSFIMFLPYLVNTLFLGAYSTQGLLNNNLNITNGFPSFKEIANFTLEVFPAELSTHAFIFFIILLFVNIKIFFNFLIFFTSLIVVYFSIDQGFWGLQKYKIEYFLPFIFFGIYIVGKYLNKNLSVIFCFIMLLINLNHYKKETWKNNHKNLNELDILVPFKYPFTKYSTKSAISNLLKKENVDSIGIIDLSYQMYPFFIQDLNVSEYIKTINNKKLLSSLIVFNNDEWHINKNLKSTEIKYLIIEAAPSRGSLIEKLINEGWVISDKIINYHHNTRVIILSR